MFKAEIKILLEKINEYRNIIIHRHKRPDLDCLGSQMALKAYLQHNFPNKNIYAVGEDGFKEFNYIGEIDIVDDELYKKSFVIVVDTANAARVEDERYKDEHILSKSTIILIMVMRFMVILILLMKRVVVVVNYLLIFLINYMSLIII